MSPVWPERPGGQGTSVLLMSFTFFLSFSLPLSLSALSAVLNGKTRMVKVREGNRRWKVERLLSAKELLMRRNCNVNTGKSCEVDDLLMAPISQCALTLSSTHPLICDDWALIHSNASATPSSIQCIFSSCLLLVSYLRSKNWEGRLLLFLIWNIFSKELRSWGWIWHLA